MGSFSAGAFTALSYFLSMELGGSSEIILEVIGCCVAVGWSGNNCDSRL